MDFADKVQALTEEHIEKSLRRRTTLTMPFSGACLSCEEPVPKSGKGKRRFCDRECRIYGENERRRKFGAIR